MLLIEFLAIITFIILLAASIWMLMNFYVCDSQTCKPFNESQDKAPKGTKTYVLSLLNELCQDGIWPLPYIGAAILTPLSLWFVNVPITVKSFALVFFISFFTIYFLFSFFGHHYIRYISAYTSDYIQNNCPATIINPANIIYHEEDPICNQVDESTDQPKESKQIFPSFSEGLGITFATPVNIF